jgi:alpha-ketoglutarate-dependent taurine dioxygenase
MQAPETGGNTGFLDTRKAYLALSSEERAKLEGAYTVVHGGDISDFKDLPVDEQPGDTAHPTLMQHPATGDIALYLPESSTKIQGKNGEVVGVSTDYIKRMEQDQGPFEFKWSEGDLVIWDNTTTMHRSMGGYFNTPRLLFRVQSRLIHDTGKPVPMRSHSLSRRMSLKMLDVQIRQNSVESLLERNSTCNERGSFSERGSLNGRGSSLKLLRGKCLQGIQEQPSGSLIPDPFQYVIDNRIADVTAAINMERQVCIKISLGKSVRNATADDVKLLKQALQVHGAICLVGDTPLSPIELKRLASLWGEVLQLPAGLAFNAQDPEVPSSSSRCFHCIHITEVER